MPDFIRSFGEIQTTPPPNSPGVYGWYFRKIPPYIPYKKTVYIRRRIKKWRLLYIGKGISLKKRILGFHSNGDADVSTLRLSLGCLFVKQLKLCLYIKPSEVSDDSYYFGDKGEEKISEWMKNNARVSWIQTPNYGCLEDSVIERYVLPLNIKGSPNPFKPLKNLRIALKKCAVPRGSKRPSKEIDQAYEKYIKESKQFV
jgi:hypothetical protein